MAGELQPTSAVQVVLRAIQLPRRWRLGFGPMIAALVLVVIVLATATAHLYVPHHPMRRCHGNGL